MPKRSCSVEESLEKKRRHAWLGSGSGYEAFPAGTVAEASSSSSKYLLSLWSHQCWLQLAACSLIR